MSPAPPDDENPPWHAYDGCYGCRCGNALARRFVLPALSPPAAAPTQENPQP